MTDLLDSEDAVASLLGRRCVSCDERLRPGQSNCCGIAYCPFCRKVYTDPCSHQMPGPESEASWICDGGLQPPPVTAGMFLAWDVPQLRAALGDVYDIAVQNCGPALTRKLVRSTALSELFRASGAVRVTYHWRRRRRDAYLRGDVWFHRNPRSVQASIQRLVEDWHRGVARLEALSPDCSRHCVAVLPLAGPYVHRLRFSADGSRILVCGTGFAEAISVQDHASIAVLRDLPVVEDGMFLPGDDRVLLVTGAGNRQHGAVTLVQWQLGNGAVRKQASSEGRPVVGNDYGGVFALRKPEAVLIREANRLRVVPLAPGGREVSLAHREHIQAVAVSPDGETLVTISAGHLAFWNLANLEGGW